MSINVMTFNIRGSFYSHDGINIWILTKDSAKKKLHTTSCEILRDAEPPVYPSDHYPVFAQLSIETL